MSADATAVPVARVWPPFPNDPAHPGWLVFDGAGGDTFGHIFGTIRMRVEGERTVRCRFLPEARHRNVLDTVHGGFIMAIVDQVLFMAPHALDIAGALGGVTIDASVQFLAPLATGVPADAMVEILRETGRMIFLRGLIEQAGVPAVGFSGTIRKAVVRGDRPG